MLIECFHGSSQADVTAARRPEFIPTLAKAIAEGIAEAVAADARPAPVVPAGAHDQAVPIKNAAGQVLAQGWLQGNQTVVGVRTLCEAMGYKVDWNPADGSVTLTPK